MSDATIVSQDQLACAFGRPSATALLKSSPADFLVDEQLGFDCTGDGEHLFLRIRKRNHSTVDVARLLAGTLQLRDVDVGYAGMKDQRAETTQWFSVRLDEKGEQELQKLQDPQIEILQTVRNERKLKIGSHRENHFQLLLRELDGSPEELESRLQRLQQEGMPNYFGGQRFGRLASNLQQAKAFLAQPDRKKLGRKRRSVLYSALRSYLFNLQLSERIRRHCWQTYVAGDVLNLDGTQRCFSVAEGEWDETLRQRLQDMDIHPAGVLPGAKGKSNSYESHGLAADIEEAVLAQYQELIDGLVQHGLDASRRAFRCRVLALEWEWQNPHQLALRFRLPRGAYATSLLRELCLTREPDARSS